MSNEEGWQSKRTIDSKDLLQGSKEILIRHEEQLYRLIVTKAGKLILNK